MFFSSPCGISDCLPADELVDLVAEDGVLLAERLAQREARGRLRRDQAGEHAAVPGRDGVGGEALRDLLVGHEDVQQDRLLGLVADAEQVGADGEALAVEPVARGALALEDRPAVGRVGLRGDDVLVLLVDLRPVARDGAEERLGAAADVGVAALRRAAGAAGRRSRRPGRGRPPAPTAGRAGGAAARSGPTAPRRGASACTPRTARTPAAPGRPGRRAASPGPARPRSAGRSAAAGRPA